MQDSFLISSYKRYNIYFNIVLLIILASITRILLSGFIFTITTSHYDSQDYLKAAIMLSSHIIHSSRLLTYPLIINISKNIFPFLETNHAVLLFQSLLGIMMSVLFYLVALQIFTRKGLALFIGALVAVNPYIISWEHCVLTEAPALFFVTLFLFAFIHYTKNFNGWYGSLMYITIIISAFCKLLFLYFIFPVFIALLIYSMVKGHFKKVFILGLIYTMVLISSATLFRHLNYRQNKINTFTETSQVLRYMKVYDYRLYILDPSNSISRYMEKATLEKKNNWDVFENHLKIVPAQKLYSFFPALFKSYPLHFTVIYLKGTLNNTFLAFKSPVAMYYCDKSYPVNHSAPFNFIPIFLIFFLTLLDVILNTVGVIRNKLNHSLMIWLFIDFFIMYVFFIMTFGSFVEFSRFFYPAYLCMILLIFRLILLLIKGHLSSEWKTGEQFNQENY